MDNEKADIFVREKDNPSLYTYYWYRSRIRFEHSFRTLIYFILLVSKLQNC